MRFLKILKSFHIEFDIHLEYPKKSDIMIIANPKLISADETIMFIQGILKEIKQTN
jgi:hypothetical protein